YPKFIPTEDDILPVEEQPLPAIASPTTESPGYINESDTNEDPEDDPKEDPGKVKVGAQDPEHSQEMVGPEVQPEHMGHVVPWAVHRLSKILCRT
nr:hypothetical protein [Tanacetum cinerariifolium]GFC07731.1 hypothetical protein [Tanacetum cinerariifolium]